MNGLREGLIQFTVRELGLRGFRRIVETVLGSGSGRFLVLCMILALGGCERTGGAPAADAQPDSLVAHAQRFRTLITKGHYAAARAMMADDARRWFEAREGEGRPWRPGPESGPWSRWDEHFRSEGEIIEWRTEERSATAVVREINDYFRLLERGSMTNEITYFFDAEERIEGLLIAAAGERPPGRTEEFLAWAREHEPEELGALMPGGEIDPSGDHPRRFRALLNRWRVAAGLEPIERTPDSPEAP